MPMPNLNSPRRPETDALPDASGALDRALAQLARRIEEIVIEEQHVLTSRPEEFDRLLARKELLAVDATRLTLAARGVLPDERVREHLERAAGQLRDNRRFLRRHIDAVSEIATLVAKTVSSTISDGTYSRRTALRDRCS